MTQDDAIRIIELLESIESKLDAQGSLESEMLEVTSRLQNIESTLCGFSHDGKQYSGVLEKIHDTLRLADEGVRARVPIDSDVSSIDSRLQQIEMALCGFSHDGKHHFGLLDKICSQLEEMNSNLCQFTESASSLTRSR